ncbi:Satratoxin biosynthesis SC1 cluster protein 4 [Apiospora marii]|uniref:Satratoxin biosynthesis SC1 cluster protein 4 n=1 Tax=Apiospora marii TaxID=335849 RepID=UPI00312EFC1E
MATPLPQNSNGPWIVTSVWALTGVASFFVLLRFYCRIFRGRIFAVDDSLLLVAWLLLLAQTILSVFSVRLGSGKHVWNIDPSLTEDLLMLQDITTAPSVLAVAFSKASAGVSLLRLLPNRWQRVLTIFIITSIGVLMTGIMVLTLVQCMPIQKHWNFQVPGHCWDPRIVAQFAIGAAIWSGVMDIILAILPMPVILGLQMNKREKLGVAIALSFMVFTDPTYDIAPVVVYGTAEIAVTMIAACIPVLRVLIRDVSRAGTIRYGHTAPSSHSGGTSSNHSRLHNNHDNAYGSAVRRPIMTPNTSSGSGSGGFGSARSLRSQKSFKNSKPPLEVTMQKTIMIEYSDAKRDSGNWILDPVNLSPRTLFDEQLTKSLSDDSSEVPKSPV